MTQDTRPTGSRRRDVTIPTAEGAIIPRPHTHPRTTHDANAAIADLLGITVEELLADPFARYRERAAHAPAAPISQPQVRTDD